MASGIRGLFRIKNGNASSCALLAIVIDAFKDKTWRSGKDIYEIKSISTATNFENTPIILEQEAQGQYCATSCSYPETPNGSSRF